MFLSTENPPNDPLSSSSNFLHLTTSSDELGQSNLSNFSIRDYAFSNRKKNIDNNWPFSSNSLHLLSTHGITDPLPPFQKLPTVRNQFETTACSPSGKQIVSYVHPGRNLTKLGLNPTIAETSKGPSRIIENGLFPSSSVSKSKVEILVAATSNKNSKKIGRGMVKTKEDNCLVTTSESIMVSKRCPICKTFSSASNTTLNAHIDQCLSVDLPLPPVCTKPKRPRLKPKMKVKTIVDIYASAKVCTLEDLDRRNGTKWASILSYTNRVIADKSEVSKKRKVSPVGIGPVYVDAKGQKLRILSEFSEKKTNQEQQDDGISQKKSLSQAGSKGNNKSLRKNRPVKKHHKYVKLTKNKGSDSEQIPDYQRGFSGEGSSSKGHRRIYNQRMLAKRSLISKKLNEKGHKFYAFREQQPSENNDDYSWSGEDPTDISATEDSRPLNKQKLQSKNVGRNETLFENKRAQSRAFRFRLNEKEESLEGVHTNTLRLKKSLASIQVDKYSPRKDLCSDAILKVSDASPIRKLSPLLHSWRRQSTPVEQKKVGLEFSEKEDEEEDSGKWEFSDEEEEETGKWELSEKEDELSDCDYVSSGDNNEKTNEVLLRSNPSSSCYDDYNDEEDDEEIREEEEDNVKTTANNVMDITDDDTGGKFYHSDSPPPMDSERGIYGYEEVGNMVYGREEDVRFDSNIGQGSLFVEVDTIPIPGPPGSFLPSPRDMGFDGNSSVITSQVQSSMDQLDRNSSESPVSAFSTFAANRLNFPAELSSDIPLPPMSFCVPSHHRTITDRNNDHEACCCQRKERISEGIALNNQASHLLQRRAASTSLAMNLTKSPTCLDPFEQLPYMIQQDLDLQSKFSNRTSLNGAVPPSPSNPVLRLMGKDLMIMNQGEADAESSRSSLKRSPQLVDHPPPPAETGLYFNTGLYLRNSFESTHHQPQKPQPQAQAQASAFRNNFDHVRYFSPS